MRLSENFTLRELTKSQTAERKGIPNEPSKEEIENLRALCKNVLQPVRDNYRVPITPSSGYRSPSLNTAIGSRCSCEHVTGQAVDFEVAGYNDKVLGRCIVDILVFDQLILAHYT